MVIWPTLHVADLERARIIWRLAGKSHALSARKSPMPCGRGCRPPSRLGRPHHRQLLRDRRIDGGRAVFCSDRFMCRSLDYVTYPRAAFFRRCAHQTPTTPGYNVDIRLVRCDETGLANTRPVVLIVTGAQAERSYRRARPTMVSLAARVLEIPIGAGMRALAW